MTIDRSSLESCPFPANHPQYIGPYLSSSQAIDDADVIVLAGTRSLIEFDWKAAPTFPTDTPLIHLCSDAAEIAKIYPTDVPLVGNAKLGLTDLLAALSQQRLSNEVQRRDYLHGACDAYQHALRQAQEEATQHATTVPVRVSALMQELAQHLTSHTIVAADSITSSTAVLTHLLPHIEGGFYMTASGSLGWGMGGALGIKLGRPNEEVIAVIGDGVFQFGIQALWTAVYYHIPVVFIVINNQSYAAVKAALQRYDGVAVKQHVFPAADISGAHIADIAHGFGALGLRIERLADLASALQRVRKHDGPAVIEVMTDPNDVGPIRR